MSDPLAWLLLVFFMGLLGFPLSFLLFGKLPDRGYAFSKPLALLLAAYVLWVLGLTGSVLNVPQTVAGILVAGTVLFGWLYYRRWPELEGLPAGTVAIHPDSGRPLPGLLPGMAIHRF